MPDIQNFLVTRLAGTVTIPVPQWTVAFQICDNTGVVIRDFTGANTFTFPQVFASFSQADQNELVQKWVMDMIRKKAPDLFP